MRLTLLQRTTNRHLSTLILIVIILGSTLGCARISELVKKGRGDGAPTPPPTRDYPGQTGGNEKENNLVKKTNFYITDCYNRYSNRIVESHNRYLSWVKNADQGPTGKESIVYGLYDVSGDGSDCEKSMASAKALEPFMPELDEAADNYVVALKEAITAIRGIYQYYEQDDYKDDNFAKGKAAHAGLMDAFSKFKTVNTTFAQQVDKLEDDVAQKELTRLTDEGKTYEATVVETGIKAKKIKNLLQNKQYEEITADELTPLIDDFSATVDKMKAGNAKPTTSMYTSACDDFLKASKEMMRRKRDNKKFTDFERRQNDMGAGWMVEGSPDKVIRAYNDMIQRRRFTQF